MPRRYRLSSAAEEDLSDIYTYTFSEFGERRADAYFDTLQDCLERLAENPRLGMDVSFIRDGYFRFIHQRHSIYFRKLKSDILVVRVLGPGMSPERRLR